MHEIAAAIRATWPPAETMPSGAFILARNDGGGSRVRAARLAEAGDVAVDPDAIVQASAQMQALGQPALYMVLAGQDGLDRALEALGYEIKDPTLALQVDCATLSAAPPPVTVFETWPPLAIQEEIWAEGGIGADRLAIMHRCDGPKISLFGRINDRPAGTAYVAIHNGLAMLHALEILPQARCKGLAAHMMRAAAHWAETQGAPRFSVLVTRGNMPARSLYASLGFEPVGHYHYRTITA